VNPELPSLRTSREGNERFAFGWSAPSLDPAWQTPLRQLVAVGIFGIRVVAALVGGGRPPGLSSCALCRRVAGLYQAALVGEHDGVHAIAEGEFRQQARHV
jgi:hypothetical protein